MATFTSNYAWTKPAGSDPVDISVLNDNLDSQDGIMHDAFLNMAEPFSESSTYAVGAIVLYGTKTYKCHTAVTTAGSWTGAANWDGHKISALVLDNTPTDGSNNPVKSDGIYDSEKDIYAVMGQMGAKNLNKFPYKNGGAGATWSPDGITYTVNADGTLDVNGSATADAYFRCGISTDDSNPIYLDAGKSYILSGSGSADIDIRLRNSNNIGVANAGVTDTLYECTTSGKYYILVMVKKNKTVNHYTVKPMLRLASDTDDTYQPYAKTNKQLTDEIATKVDKVTGKGLSTNDYTNTDKAEVAKVANKADKTATASGETLALVPTSEGRALLRTAYGMSVQNGTPTPSSPVDIESAKANFTSTHGQDGATVTTDLTLRAIEVTSSDAYNLVRDGKYYIADTLDYTEDDGFVVTRRVGIDKLDGSESWTLPSDRATQYGNSFRLPNYDEVLTGIKPATGNNFDLVTDKFRCFSLIGGLYIYASNSTTDWGSGTYRTSSNLWVSMGAADMATAGVTDLTSFQTWLGTHNIDILYPIVPTTESITTAQALALLGLKTYDESTTITSQAEPSCTIAIEYAKERLGALALTAYNTAKGNDLRITASES